MDLIHAAAAKYFVITTKHHDGFALFDTFNTSNRNSLLYGPKRDLLHELFTAAEIYHPSLRRGTYFSLPEWFNPDFQPYGFAQQPGDSSTSWPGIIARNPYTGLEEPYTGHIPVKDFISDLMVPQMEILAYKYTTGKYKSFLSFIFLFHRCNASVLSLSNVSLTPRHNLVRLWGCERDRSICSVVVELYADPEPTGSDELALRHPGGS